MMYNHYIPQSDGSYRRSSVPDSHRRNPPRPQPKPEPPKQEPKPEPPRDCPPEPKPTPPPQHPCKPEKQKENILDFLKGLLPREIDTADLMIIFLLLLMNKDEEDGLSPMLTLALYFLL